MFDKSILAPINQCQYTGLEVPVTSKIVASARCRYFRDNFGGVRIIAPGGAGAILLEKIGDSYSIRGLYVLPEKRRQGIASSLLAMARILLGNVNHSNTLTHDGAGFAANRK